MKPLNLVMLLALLLSCSLSYAADKITAIKTVANPAQKMGIQVGDVLVRQVNILAKTGEPITPKSLPVKGTRVEGMELSDVKLSQVVKQSQTHYMLELRYQVFAHATQATEMQLPQETITIVDGEDLKLPAWKFWYSPLVNSDLEAAKTTILPQAKVSLIDQSSRLMRLLAFAGLFLLGAIGLVYINADRYLLPFMGGNFSRAHRQVKAIAKKRLSEANAPKDALAHIHEAFNQQFGRGLYPNKIDAFLASNPAFNKLKTEITAFFALSNQTLFGDAPTDNAQVMQKILSFSKQLRDCERGV